MKKIVYSLILLFSLFSCEDFITEKPETHLNNQNSWKTELEVAAAVYGLHQNFRKTFGNVVIINRDRGLPFDYLANPLAKTSQNKLESTWKLSSAYFVWADYYRVIANCHWILENLYRANLSEDRQNFYKSLERLYKCLIQSRFGRRIILWVMSWQPYLFLRSAAHCFQITLFMATKV